MKAVQINDKRNHNINQIIMKDKNQALEVIKQALNIATMKGAFNLMDTQNILEALSILETPEIPTLDKEK